jgi:hypothetical protein
MTPVIDQRMTAEIEGDFVVFLIGLRINKFWKVHKWLPAAFAMPRMLKELSVLPKEQTGFLGYHGGGPNITVQYWRSFDHLEAYARAPENAHFPAWIAFNKRIKASREDVGIWHETYLVKAGHYETLYSGMPPTGLGRASTLVPATGHRKHARTRVQINTNDET